MHSRVDPLSRLPAATAVLASSPEVLAAYAIGSVLDVSRERVRDVDLAILVPRELFAMPPLRAAEVDWLVTHQQSIGPR